MWCILAAAAAVAQISASSLRPVHRRVTLGFPGEGPFRWTEFLEAKVEKRLEEEEEEEDADEEEEKGEAKGGRKRGIRADFEHERATRARAPLFSHLRLFGAT